MSIKDTDRSKIDYFEVIDYEVEYLNIYKKLQFYNKDFSIDQLVLLSFALVGLKCDSSVFIENDNIFHLLKENFDYDVLIKIAGDLNIKSEKITKEFTKIYERKLIEIIKMRQCLAVNIQSQRIIVKPIVVSKGLKSLLYLDKINFKNIDEIGQDIIIDNIQINEYTLSLFHNITEHEIKRLKFFYFQWINSPIHQRIQFEFFKSKADLNKSMELLSYIFRKTIINVEKDNPILFLLSNNFKNFIVMHGESLLNVIDSDSPVFKNTDTLSWDPEILTGSFTEKYIRGFNEELFKKYQNLEMAFRLNITERHCYLIQTLYILEILYKLYSLHDKYNETNNIERALFLQHGDRLEKILKILFGHCPNFLHIRKDISIQEEIIKFYQVNKLEKNIVIGFLSEIKQPIPSELLINMYEKKVISKSKLITHSKSNDTRSIFSSTRLDFFSGLQHIFYNYYYYYYFAALLFIRRSFHPSFFYSDSNMEEKIRPLILKYFIYGSWDFYEKNFFPIVNKVTNVYRTTMHIYSGVYEIKSKYFVGELIRFQEWKQKQIWYRIYRKCKNMFFVNPYNRLVYNYNKMRYKINVDIKEPFTEKFTKIKNNIIFNEIKKAGNKERIEHFAKNMTEEAKRNEIFKKERTAIKENFDKRIQAKIMEHRKRDKGFKRKLKTIIWGQSYYDNKKTF